MIKIDWNPSAKNLRIFGVATFVFCCILAAILHFAHDASLTTALILVGAGAAVALVGLVVPPAIRPVFVVLSAITLPIGIVVSTVLLASIYYLLLTPLGLLARLFGHDPMKKRFEPDRGSYWTERTRPDSVKRYFRQY